jgi:hypothetical protein
MGHGVEGLLPIGLKWRFSKGKLDLDEEIVCSHKYMNKTDEEGKTRKKQTRT